MTDVALVQPKSSSTGKKEASKGAKTRNWALFFGILLSLGVLVVAVFGPLLAPADPMKENFIAEYGGKFIRPPFPPGVEGFPLGSDEWGRDVLSRLLWGLRPTLILVLVVAALRMFIGVIVGLYAGWSRSWFSRVLDTLISSFISMPVLFIALCVVAALARRWGVWAFILGLSITGWTEAARIVQEQTRAVKNQPFIEASRAMGAAGAQTVLGHVIPHILPLMWIQLAFEVSMVMLTSAALNFLGYFVNAVWIPIEDFVNLRVSGTPELGQMLGVSTNNQPWTAISAGTAVFLVVLSFNLLGEGLRIALGPERRRRKAESNQVVDRAGNWIEERLYFALSEWRRTAATGGAFFALAVVVLGGGYILWRTQNLGIPVTQVKTVGGAMWATATRDAQGTYWSGFRGPAAPDVLWTGSTPGAIIGGPVIDGKGNMYFTGFDGWLYGMSPDGQPMMSVKTPGPFLGWPALTPDGNIVAMDERGAVSAFSPAGDLLWEYQTDPAESLLGNPIVGPDGMVYFSTRNFLIALTAQGQREWQILLPTYSYTSPTPRLSADGEYIFFEDTVVDAHNGETLFKQTREPMDTYLVGSDGKTYYRTPDTFMEWTPTEKGAVMAVKTKLDTRVIGTSTRFPYFSGVAPSQHVWLLYGSPFEYPRIIWSDAKGQSPQIIDFPYSFNRMIGVDANAVLYMCGKLSDEAIECRAVELATGIVLWKTSLPTIGVPAGGALVEGRLYVASTDGKVFAVGQ